MQMAKYVLYCAFASVGMKSAIAESMTQHEREHLIAHLQMTGTWLPDEVSSLSAAQLTFRSAHGSWTIAEVVQHLVVAEPNYWKLFQDGLRRAPATLTRKASDADVLWYGIDRTRHEKTSEDQNPMGQKIDISEALVSCAKLHAKMLDYARKTQDELRAHTIPEWGVDAYQCLLEISTHEQRHILQIREIKGDPGFPKR